jgi:hypothetical protein
VLTLEEMATTTGEMGPDAQQRVLDAMASCG